MSLAFVEEIDELAVAEQRGRGTESLYAIEDGLLALIDSEELVPEEKEREFQAALEKQFRKAIAKRDAVGQFIRHCETMAEASKSEEIRLRDRRKFYERAAEKMRSYVKNILETLGTDERGSWRRLEGNTFSFFLRDNNPSVRIVDPEAVPNRFKDITMTVPADVMHEVLSAVSPELRDRFVSSVKNTEIEIPKTPIKKAFESGEMVDGADLVHEMALVIR
jgi:hypothetical protein